MESQVVTAPNAIPILGIPVHAVTMDATLALVDGYMIEPQLHQIATVNPEFIMAAQGTPTSTGC
jgi:N-acetylglucosaminyldiphosphoundecaprenol N-acetyl-beta-D-mannosaminyltransferase